MSFVLVHGASHGAWCWDRTVPYLDADPRVGAVVAIDLPGRPGARDPKPVGEIRIADYVRCIADEIVLQYTGHRGVVQPFQNQT